MKLYTIEKVEPIDDEWYIVYCPEYSESEYAIAKWDSGNWYSEGLSTPVHDYVKAYFPTPLNKM